MSNPIRTRRVGRAPGVRAVGRVARLGSAVAGALLAAGCMVGPDYTRPEASLNEAWMEKAGGAPEASVDAYWWETFDDPTLTTLVLSAFRQNLSLRAAGLRVLEARAARGVAVGRFFPQTQQVTGGVAAHQTSANDVGSFGEQWFTTDSVGLEAAWELDFWGKFRRGIEAADAEVQFTVADYDAVLVSLAAEVATDYILIRALQERLDVARNNVSLQAETLRLTDTKFRAGAVSELDVSTARSTLANTQATVPNLEDAIRQTTLALCVLLGRTPSDLEAELRPASGGAAHVPDAPQTIALGVPADLLRRRPDVRAAERLAAAQSARIGQAEADLLPQIAITGATGFVSSTFSGTHQPDLGNIFDANSFAGFIGLQVNWPILNYGRITGVVRVTDARFQQAVTAYQDTVLRAASEVEAGLSAFLKSKERTDYLAQAVDASQRSVDLSLIQYRAGAVDFIRVNIAQTDLLQQQDSYVSSRAQIALGAVRAFRALGGGWEVREGQEFIDEATAKQMRERTDWGDVLGPGWENGKDLGFARPPLEGPAQGDKK